MTLSLDPASSEQSGHPKTVELGPDATPPVQRRTLSRSMLLGLLPAALILVIALLGPFFVPYSTRDVVALPDIAPSGAHWFGTDSAGLDVFSRTVAAARNNLMIGLLTTVAATGMGIVLGLTIGMNESRRGPVGPVRSEHPGEAISDDRRAYGLAGGMLHNSNPTRRTTFGGESGMVLSCLP